MVLSNLLGLGVAGARIISATICNRLGQEGMNGAGNRS